MKKIKIYWKILKYKIVYFVWIELYAMAKRLEWDILEPMYSDPDLDAYLNDYDSYSGN